MRRRRRRLSRRGKLGAVLLIIIAILFVIAVFRADKAVKPAAAIQAEYYSKLTANEIISSTVSEYLEENRFTYSDFAAVLFDESGKAVSIEAVTYNINKAQSELGMMINSAFEQAGDTSAEIPLGTLTDSFLLAGKGPRIRLRICPANEATVRLTSSFEEAGINQTCHRISAVITAEIRSSVPLYSFETTVSFEFLLAENVIVGGVPESTISVWSEEGIVK